MKRIICTLSLILILGSIYAQSKLLYVGMSAILPGSGEIALGKTNRGATLLALDILSMAGFYHTGNEIDYAKSSYKQYALAYAGVPMDRSDNYYQRIQDYYSSTEYNTFQELRARNYYLIYLYDPESFEEYMAANIYSGDMTWEWESDANWKQYQSLRGKHQKAKINNNFFLGVLILNRLVSVIDVTFINRHKSTPSGSISFSPLPEKGLMLNYNLEF